MAIKEKLERNIKSYEPIHENIIRVDLNIKGYDSTITGVYAPTENAKKEEKGEFTNTLVAVLEKFQTGKNAY